jgi:hypothetical protein
VGDNFGVSNLAGCLILVEVVFVDVQAPDLDFTFWVWG